MDCCLISLIETIYQNKTSHPFLPTMTISIAGAGGKTSILHQLVSEWKSRGDTGICIGTTTTQMFYPEDDGLYDEIITYETAYGLSARTLFFFSKYYPQTNKVQGLPPEILDDLKHRKKISLIITESDGARGKSIKAPNGREPLHPSTTDIVLGVIGLDSFGKHKTEEVIQRIAYANKITDIDDRPLDVKTYIDLIEHPQGLFKQVPEHALKILVLNKADTIKSKTLKMIKESLILEQLPIDGILMTSLEPHFCLYHSLSL